MNRVDDPTSRTAEQWRAEARRCHQSAADSWERSDTDGFLSQWASQQMAFRYETLAKIAENGGLHEMAFLADAEGNIIEGARLVETRYGRSWVFYDAEQGPVWFRGSNHRDPEIAKARDLAKGYQVVYREIPVVMYSDGSLHAKR